MTKLSTLEALNFVDIAPTMFLSLNLRFFINLHIFWAFSTRTVSCNSTRRSLIFMKESTKLLGKKCHFSLSRLESLLLIAMVLTSLLVPLPLVVLSVMLFENSICRNNCIEANYYFDSNRQLGPRWGVKLLTYEIFSWALFQLHQVGLTVWIKKIP